MTSFAFILGVLPLVLATGAGASARKSIGMAVFFGMIASTCLVVVFVPSFYVVMQWLEERRKGKRVPGGRPPSLTDDGRRQPVCSLTRSRHLNTSRLALARRAPYTNGVSSRA